MTLKDSTDGFLPPDPDSGGRGAVIRLIVTVVATGLTWWITGNPDTGFGAGIAVATILQGEDRPDDDNDDEE